MASQKQIAANQRNAQLSTGPRSADSKAKVRCNALRDGLTGQVVTLSDEERPFFDQLLTEMLADFNPQSTLERKLTHAVAWDTWRLDHLRAVESNVYALGRQEQQEAEQTAEEPDNQDTGFADARTHRTESPRLERMSLYESRMTRNIHRNVALLRELQAERKRNYERDKQEEIRIARLCEFNDMPIKASARPSKNGFVFSNEEIAVGAVRERYAAAGEHFVKKGNPTQLYGGLILGVGDTILEKIIDKRPLSVEERREIQSTPPEDRALHRLMHPEEYDLGHASRHASSKTLSPQP